MIIRAPAADVHWHHQQHLATALLFIQTASHATHRLQKAVQATHIHGMIQVHARQEAVLIHHIQKTASTGAAEAPVQLIPAALTPAPTFLKIHAAATH